MERNQLKERVLTRERKWLEVEKEHNIILVFNDIDDEIVKYKSDVVLGNLGIWVSDYDKYNVYIGKYYTNANGQRFFEFIDDKDKFTHYLIYYTGYDYYGNTEYSSYNNPEYLLIVKKDNDLSIDEINM